MAVPGIIEKDGNPVKSLLPYKVSPEALSLFNSFGLVADLHCDALLWGRDLTKRSEHGHSDLPGMQEGNNAMQVFTVVSKSPKGQNMEASTAGATDNITLLKIAQGRPVSNWFSLLKRAHCQSALLQGFSDGFDGLSMTIKSKEDVQQPAESGKTDKNIIGGYWGPKEVMPMGEKQKIWTKLRKQESGLSGLAAFLTKNSVALRRV